MGSYFAVAEICIPNTILDSLSYSIDEGVEKGAVVWVSLRGHKKLGIVLNITHDAPKYELKPATKHESGYMFSERYLETLQWCANYYMCSVGEALTAFWPADLEKYLCSLPMNSKMH
ncbi:MAG: hypothetical protein FWB90_04725 [Fibromonadales bacterium]|nr:hypothetical protein [Fibromonadales bacterium]